MPRKAKRGGKKRKTAMPARRRPRRLLTKAQDSSRAVPPPARAIPSLRPPSPSTDQDQSTPHAQTPTRLALPLCDFAESSLPALPTPPPLPPMLRRLSVPTMATFPPPPPLPPAPLRTRKPCRSTRGAGTALDLGLVETSKRRRRQPQRFCARHAQREPEPEHEKTIFDGISRDSLQRYMAHFDMTKRQDLKRNLAQRVQEHFEKMDISEIDLKELHNGVKERLRNERIDEEKQKKMGKYGKKSM